MNCSSKSVKTSLKWALRHGALGAAMVVSASVLSTASAAKAGLINWVDWTSTGSNTVGGNIMGNNVLFNGQYFFAQTAGGTNYWIPNTAYLSATVSNEPPANDIIAFSDPGQRSLTFTTAVTDLVFAYVSINTNTYTFDHEFDLISNGEGFFGSGPVSKVNNGNGTWSLVAQSGEPHGVIQFAGTLSSLNWNVAVLENWNGFTVGVSDVTPASVPGPLGVLGAATAFGWSRRIRRKIGASSR